MVTPTPFRLAHPPHLIGVAIAAITLFACIETSVSGIATPLSFCLDKAEVDCHVYFDCFDQTRRNGLKIPGAQSWLDESDCVTKQKALCMPEPMVCESNLVFQEMRASDCIDAWNSVSCADWNQPDAPKPPACYKCDQVTKDNCVLSYCTKPTSI